MISIKTTLFGLAALTLLATVTVAEGRRGEHGRKFLREGARAERLERRGEIAKFVRSLEITDFQRAQALAAAKSIAPIASAARAEARGIIENARKSNQTGDKAAIRAAAREQIKALRERAVEQAKPFAQGVFDLLTVEQKAKLAAAAEKHGRTFDADRAVRRMTRLLARPRAVEFLEARTKR